MLTFDRPTFETLRMKKNILDVVLSCAEDEVERTGIPQIDYLVYNEKN
jgi:hypothetical protein